MTIIEKVKKYWGDEKMGIIEKSDFDALREYEEIEGETIEEDENFSYSLTSHGMDLTVKGLVDKIKNNDIKQPVFQRDYVWKKKDASRFIESLLMGLPIPGLFFYKNNEECLEVIDGMQRLSTIVSFYGNSFKEKPFSLTGSNNKYKGFSYANLQPSLRRKLDDTIIHSTVVNPIAPKEKNYKSLFLMFERLNTGGMILVPQEIRHCMYRGVFLTKISELAEKDYFKDFLGIKTERKKHEEICLRLIALGESYENYTGNFKGFLNDFLEDEKEGKIKVDDNFSLIFEKSINWIIENIEKSIIKPETRKINLAILDAIFVVVYKNTNRLSGDIKEKIKETLKSQEFIDSIQRGITHNKHSVVNRIDLMINSINDDL